MFWPRRRPGTHGTHFVSMSGPTVHPYTVSTGSQTSHVDRRMSIQKMLRKRIPLHPSWNYVIFT